MQGLILDTSTDRAIIGRVEGLRLQGVEVLSAAKQLSSHLFTAIQPRLAGIVFIAVGSGPGSYVGIRTGATAAKLLALACDIPLIGFPSLLVSLPKDLKGAFLFVGDAKMGEDYLVRGQVAEGRVGSLSAPQIIPSGRAADYLSKGEVLVKGGQIEPHFKWALAHVHDALGQQQTVRPEALKLSYVR